MKPYELIRTKRRTMALQITRDMRIVVRAPLRLAKRHIDSFVEKHDAWIDAHMEALRRSMQTRPELTPQQIEALRALAKEELPQRVSHYGEIMGLMPSNVRITSARTRFGSCSGKNALCFSLYLMRYPQQAIDYVVVHELAHILHKNHGREFYALVEAVMPAYKAYRAMLKTPIT